MAWYREIWFIGTLSAMKRKFIGNHLRVGKQGQITLPASICRQANLAEGDVLEVLVDADGSIRLVPISTDAQALLVKGLHTPLVDDELFDKCQKIRAERRRQQNSNQTTRRVYLLSGVIACAECGRRMRAQTAHSVRYYRESARFSGIECQQHGKSVRADVVEGMISELMESLVLPDNWQSALQEILNTKKDELDSTKEKARLKSEIRRMREAYKRGLYEDDEHTFWRDVEGLQAQLDALEQLTPHEMRQAGQVLASLQSAWRAATMEEKAELCQIILKQVVYDFKRGEIVKVLPKAEYEVLFEMAGLP